MKVVASDVFSQGLSSSSTRNAASIDSTVSIIAFTVLLCVNINGGVSVVVIIIVVFASFPAFLVHVCGCCIVVYANIIAGAFVAISVGIRADIVVVAVLLVVIISVSIAVTVGAIVDVNISFLLFSIFFVVLGGCSYSVGIGIFLSYNTVTVVFFDSSTLKSSR